MHKALCVPQSFLIALNSTSLTYIQNNLAARYPLFPSLSSGYNDGTCFQLSPGLRPVPWLQPLVISVVSSSTVPGNVVNPHPPREANLHW